MSRYNPGDLVYAAANLFNDPAEDTGDSAIPGIAAGELLVAAGTRGVVVNVGQVEALPSEEIYLVRFEIETDGVLSEPIGCLPEELHQGPLAA